MRNLLCPLALLAGLLVGGGSRPAESKEQADPALAHEEKLLKDAGVATDGPGLVAFFNSQALSAADQGRLQGAVRRLGDDAFVEREKASRELVAAGRLACRYLVPALKDPDPEVARRARLCLERVNQVPYTARMTAAAHLASVRRAPGTAAALLKCLPWVEDEAVEEAIFEALGRAGLRDGTADPAVTAAAADKEPLRRAAAASVLGRAGAAERKRALRLLSDADSRVRFHAATALVRRGERAAVPVLLALLTEAPTALVWQVEDVLGRLADERGPQVTVGRGEEADRRKCRKAWEAWWKDKGPRIDLTRVKLDEALLGLNTVIELDGARRGGGRVWECGVDGKPRWQITTIGRPIDAQVLPGGRVLVAENGPAQVTERDRTGKVLWEQRTNGQPVCCQRLANGNTLIATYNEVTEVSRDNKVAFSHRTTGGMIFNARKLRNGHYVYVQSNNQVIEMDGRGRVLRTVPVGNTSGWASVEALPGGHYLVALYGSNKVVEVDTGGKVVWEHSVASPGHASRLRNGNTLIASITGCFVVEVDRQGKEVWRQKTQGRPFHVWRR